MPVFNHGSSSTHSFTRPAWKPALLWASQLPDSFPTFILLLLKNEAIYMACSFILMKLKTELDEAVYIRLVPVLFHWLQLDEIESKSTDYLAQHFFGILLLYCLILLFCEGGSEGKAVFYFKL